MRTIILDSKNIGEFYTSTKPAPVVELNPSQMTINIELGNAAFEDPAELGRILHKLAERVESRLSDYGRLTDSNGNNVGTWTIE